MYYDTADNQYSFCLYNGSYKWESYVGCDYANSWTPDPNTVCVGKSFTQINNCTSETRTVFGTKLACPLPSSKKVFVTSKAYDGNLDGVVGADAKCQELASAAGLSGVYLAWIATDDTNDPESRFVKNDGPYVLVDGTKIAENWEGLIDGYLLHSISKSEKSLSPSGSSGGSYVWTNVATNGKFFYESSANNDCFDYHVASNNNGSQGEIINSPFWTKYVYLSTSLDSCYNKKYLYCFEQ